MHGQYFGDVFDDSGKKIGAVITLIDPDVSVGHAIYRPDAGGGPRVAKIAITGGHDASFSLFITSYPEYESAYRVSDVDRLPADTNYTALTSNFSRSGWFDIAWSDATGTIGTAKLIRIRVSEEGRKRSTLCRSTMNFGRSCLCPSLETLNLTIKVVSSAARSEHLSRA